MARRLLKLEIRAHLERRETLGGARRRREGRKRDREKQTHQDPLVALRQPRRHRTLPLTLASLVVLVLLVVRVCRFHPLDLRSDDPAANLFGDIRGHVERGRVVAVV
jgi:hypothetical protein